MIRHRKVHNDVYHAEFLFIDSDSEEQVDKKYGVTFNELGGCVGTEVDDVWTIIVMINSKHEEFNIGTLAHECGHATSLLFEFIGAQHPTWKTDEPYQYMLAWTVREAMKAYGFKLKTKR